jgi:hypothetical protein
MLREDGTTTQIRAHSPQIKLPEEIKLEFSNSGKWPQTRYHSSIEILLGVEDQEIQPQCLEIKKNLEIFKSQLSTTIILGGSHEKIDQPISQMCGGYMSQDSEEFSTREVLTSERWEVQIRRKGWPDWVAAPHQYEQQQRTEQDKDAKGEEDAPHRHNRQQEVINERIRTDNGAVPKTIRTDETRPTETRAVGGRIRERSLPRVHPHNAPEALEEVELSPSLVWRKVTDKVSRTAAGFLFHRIASGTTQEPLMKEGSKNDLGCHAQNTQELIEDASTNYWIWIWIRRTENEGTTRTDK